jgi:acetyltransferase-like isoleucine patch superfamily enzyme
MGGGNVLIGENCLFSQNITFRPSDVHKIYSKNNHNLINPVKDIIIQNNVWVGQDVLFAKGSVIPNGSIVGMGSVVTKPFLTENAIYAGNPAKMVKENVYWEH